MDRCDALIVGGGPAGSSCAWRLRGAGLDVVVMDKAHFPRDKVCAGWITPQVVRDLALDLVDYQRGRTLQPISGFRVGMMGEASAVTIRYDRPVSYGIRRCEFDEYLLNRSSARLHQGTTVQSLVYDRGSRAWVVNDTVRTPILIGAGGHFCPVSRWLNGKASRGQLVAAQEAEYPVEGASRASGQTPPSIPELFLCRDLAGYGWCFRKGAYVNVGLGRLRPDGLPQASRDFGAFLERRGCAGQQVAPRWRGHAYLLSEPAVRQVVGDGVLLVGDAAGLAYPRSGEGIRPAVESGLLAASTVLDLSGQYSRSRLEIYEERLRKHFARRVSDTSDTVPRAGRIAEALVPRLLRLPWFVRHQVLDRSFLRVGEPPLVDLDFAWGGSPTKPQSRPAALSPGR